jgi:DNA-binding transcriptional MerR regulator
MRIGEVAAQAGVTTKAIRYYERIGLLAPPARTEAGYRRYDAGTLTRLRFVRAAQAVGLSLGEIREVIAFRDRGVAPDQLEDMAAWGLAAVAEGDHLADLAEAEPDGLGGPHEAQPGERARVVAAIAGLGARRGGQDSDPLVVADGLCRHAGLRGHLADPHTGKW